MNKNNFFAKLTKHIAVICMAVSVFTESLNAQVVGNLNLTNPIINLSDNMTDMDFLLLPKDINSDFTNQMSNMFAPLDKNKIPHGILLDYGMEFTNVRAFNVFKTILR